MSRLEPADDDGIYGTPMIEQLKATTDPEKIDTLIKVETWDAQFHGPAYAFSPSCVPVGQTSLYQILAALQAARIRAVVTLRMTG